MKVAADRAAGVAVRHTGGSPSLQQMECLEVGARSPAGLPRHSLLKQVHKLAPQRSTSRRASQRAAFGFLRWKIRIFVQVFFLSFFHHPGENSPH